MLKYLRSFNWLIILVINLFFFFTATSLIFGQQIYVENATLKVGGKPILYGIEGEGRELLSRVEGNIWFKPGCIESFKLALMSLRECYPRLVSKSKQNMMIVKEKFTRERMVDELELAFRKLLNRPSR